MRKLEGDRIWHPRGLMVVIMRSSWSIFGHGNNANLHGIYSKKAYSLTGMVFIQEGMAQVMRLDYCVKI